MSVNRPAKLGWWLVIGALLLVLVFGLLATQIDRATSMSSPELQNPRVERGAPPSSRDAPNAMERVRPTKLRGRNNTFYDVIENGGSIKDALEASTLASSEMNSQAASMVLLASSVCGADIDPTDSTNPEFTDNNRAWAVIRLSELCEGFDPRNYKFKRAEPDLVNVLRASGKEVAASEALSAISSAQDYQELYDAGQVLLETRGLPMVQSGQLDGYGHTDLVRAWSNAATLLMCDEAGGCGRNALQTAAFCARLGCTPNANLAAAYRQRLPAGEHALMVKFYNWMASQRRK